MDHTFEQNCTVSYEAILEGDDEEARILLGKGGYT